MRPAARFVRCSHCARHPCFDSKPTAGSAWVTASSLSKVSGLDIRYGDKVRAEGYRFEAADVVGDLLALAANNFGVEREDEGPTRKP